MITTKVYEIIILGGVSEPAAGRMIYGREQNKLEVDFRSKLNENKICYNLLLSQYYKVKI